MIDAQKHGNVLLGHILLYAPLLCALNNRLQRENSKYILWDEFWAEVEFIIQNANEEDGALLAEAILYAHPGGLKNPGGVPFDTKYDFTDPNSPENIRDDKVNLKDLFQESAQFDSISREYIQTYYFSRKIIETWLIPNLKCYTTQESLVLALFMHILSIEPDSLILRKNTEVVAKKIQNMAYELTQNGAISNQNNLHSNMDRIKKLDDYLRQAAGKLNPGTTADLTACVLFIGFLFQIIN
jgi:triphosphoribosyl-dephospho-CoA synthetase